MSSIAEVVFFIFRGESRWICSGQISSRVPKTRPISPKSFFAFSKGNGTPAISGKSRLVKYYSIWPDLLVGLSHDWENDLKFKNNVDSMKISMLMDEAGQIIATKPPKEFPPNGGFIVRESSKNPLEFRFSNYSNLPRLRFAASASTFFLKAAKST